MTIAEAKKALELPLVFGNVEQIAALAFLENVEECKAKIADCENLDDHIEMDDDRRDESILLDLEDCACTAGFKGDVIVAAMRETIKGLRNA